jgi:hypothetical protein
LGQGGERFVGIADLHPGRRTADGGAGHCFIVSTAPDIVVSALVGTASQTGWLMWRRV